MRRSYGTHGERALDVLIALAAFAFTVGFMALPEQRDSVDRDLDALGVVLAAAATLPLVLHRRAPLAVFVFVTLASALMVGVGYPPGPPVGPAIALFFVGASGARLRGSFPLTFALVLGLLVLHLAAAGVNEGRFPGPELLLGTPLWAAVWFGGDRIRLRRERMAELEERARRAERERERERQLAVAEERTRIARDLHDSAGHAINVILVQAGAARLLHETNPEESRRAIATIEEVARATVGEIDRLVRVLRENDAAELSAPADPAAVDDLLDRHRAGGLQISTEIRGSRGPLPHSVAWAAYRILQEALTNAARHGRGSADVALSYQPAAVEITVTNPTNGATVSEGNGAGGHGIVGMRERASLLGGTLDTHAGAGTFRLHARLPHAGLSHAAAVSP
jgi:signal transduction histidine kinase